MKTLSLESTPSVNAFAFKSALALFGQFIGATVAYIVSLAIASALLPMPQSILEKTPEVGMMSLPAAMLFNGAVNAVILLWVARRSSLKGFALAGQLFLVSFLTQSFQTQIETGYFLSAFPLLNGNYEVYRLMLRGAIACAVFVLMVTLFVGGFSRKPREVATFTVHADQFLKAGAWLAIVYVALYMLFGYFVAWQSQTLRVFYGGPAELNSLLNQWSTALMNMPELPVFQYFRGFLWIVCLIPLFKGFTGRRVELVILSALVLGLLPTVGLAFPNPLMPAEVSLYHFWEVSISTGLFGAFGAWFVPTKLVVN